MKALIALAVCLLAAPAWTEQLALVVLSPQFNKAGALPEGWQVKVNRGAPDIALVKDPAGSYLRLRSQNSSFGIEKPVDVDPRQTPWLRWKWEVTKLPENGDFRHSHTDDQAAQLLIAFADRRILTYIWDSNAPKGTIQSASSLPLVHVTAIVCQSGAQDLGRWLIETRNVAEDYERAYGRSVPRVKGIRLQINSQHTGTSAEAHFGEVAFNNSK